LRFGFAGADDEEVGEDGLHVDIEHEDIDALFVQQGVNQQLSQFQTFQITPSLRSVW
jgi:hypothetical protein